MPKETQFDIAAPDGKLAVLLPGLGAVSTTFIAGVWAVQKAWENPSGRSHRWGRSGSESEQRSARP